MSGSAGLAELLYERLTPELRSALGSADEVERTLQRWLDEARATWPAVELADAEFVRFVATRVERAPHLQSLAELHGVDLYLVAACLLGRAQALAAVEGRDFPALDRAIRRLHVEPWLSLDDVKQEVRLRLFVADRDQPPRIDQYSGLGELVSFIRVSAIRLALRLSMRHRRERSRLGTDGDRLCEPAARDVPPELRHLRSTMQPIFRQAFATALAALSPRQRTLLSHHYLDKLSTTQIAAIYAVHRVTAIRWMVEARRRLLDTLRTELAQHLGAEPAEVDSLLRYVKSQFEITLSGLNPETRQA